MQQFCNFMRLLNSLGSIYGFNLTANLVLTRGKMLAEGN